MWGPLCNAETNYIFTYVKSLRNGYNLCITVQKIFNSTNLQIARLLLEYLFQLCDLSSLSITSEFHKIAVNLVNIFCAVVLTYLNLNHLIGVYFLHLDCPYWKGIQTIFHKLKLIILLDIHHKFNYILLYVIGMVQAIITAIFHVCL